VHDASFPAGDGSSGGGSLAEDVGRGTPYGGAARAFFQFLSARGFDGIQLGPQGKVSLANPSPYDGAMMARSHLSVALGPLVDEPGLAGLLLPEELHRAVAHVPALARHRAHHQHAWPVVLGAMRVASRRFRASPSGFAALAEAEHGFLARQGDWLESDDLFEALAATHGTDDVAAWPELDRCVYHHAEGRGERSRALARKQTLLAAQSEVVALNHFTQLLLQVQHARLRTTLGGLGLRLYADLQVGMSPRDRWRHAGLLLPGNALGAPPSRTNPEGQAWGYPVLDPQHLQGAGDDPAAAPALRFFDRRLQRLFAEFDGIRIDHPHGLISPWVYRTAGTGRNEDDLAAVRAGARLFDSPDLPDHPDLARYAISARYNLAPEDEARPRYADDWVRQLSPAQIDRYATLMDRVMAIARRHGAGEGDVCAEVLSTCPYPVARVLQRHGLGRVRVVQKANPDDAGDSYRSENAGPADWITLGTHDTRPIAPVLDGWRQGDGARAASWARYLGQRLAPGDAGFAAALGHDRRRLLDALTADLFLGPARQVSVFFADLLGLRETYNVPGTVDPSNWTLRVPPDFAAHHAREVQGGDALDLRAALALALRARAQGQAGDTRDLADALTSR
jgi:4-alpha-glucanotransferase